MSIPRGCAAFTLVEVVVALVVLEVCVVGVASLLALASATLTRAERLESAVATAEGVLDSLRATSSPVDGRQPAGGGWIVWSVAPEGAVVVRAEGEGGARLLELHGRRTAR